MSGKTELDQRYRYIKRNGTVKDLDKADKIILDASDNLYQIQKKIKGV